MPGPPCKQSELLWRREAYRATAECQDCGWPNDFQPYEATRKAKRHAAEMGHRVITEQVNRAVYAPPDWTEAPCSCGDRRWVEDENWQPEHEGEMRAGRRPRAGLLPCAYCNEDGSAPLAVAP